MIFIIIIHFSGWFTKHILLFSISGVPSFTVSTTDAATTTELHATQLWNNVHISLDTHKIY